MVWRVDFADLQLYSQLRDDCSHEVSPINSRVDQCEESSLLQVTPTRSDHAPHIVYAELPDVESTTLSPVPETGDHDHGAILVTSPLLKNRPSRYSITAPTSDAHPSQTSYATMTPDITLPKINSVLAESATYRRQTIVVVKRLSRSLNNMPTSPTTARAGVTFLQRASYNAQIQQASLAVSGSQSQTQPISRAMGIEMKLMRV